jgi:hypothetical protein
LNQAWEEQREIKPTVSAGLVFLPNAYISVLVGVTAARFVMPAVPATDDEPARPETTRRFSSITVGVGGNLDLLSAVFK